MNKNGEQQLTQLDEEVTQLGETSRRALADAVRAVIDGDAGVAMRVLAGQPGVIAAWRRTELHGQALLAETGQAIELQSRVVLALEVGLDALWVQNHARNIARTYLCLAEAGGTLPGSDLRWMSFLFLELLDRALAAFSRHDGDQAEAVCRLSYHVEALHTRALPDWFSPPARNDRHSGPGCHFAQVVRELERVGDRSADIADRVARTSHRTRAVLITPGQPNQGQIDQN